MVVPLLIRGLRSKITATRRQAAVIIDNMSKLVDDPIDAAPFLPTLMPALAFAADSMSDPEARVVAERSTAQLNRLSNLCEQAKLQTKLIDHGVVLAALKAKVAPKVAADNELVLSYFAHLCCSLMSLKRFEADQWAGIQKYLAVVCVLKLQRKFWKHFVLNAKRCVRLFL